MPSRQPTRWGPCSRPSRSQGSPAGQERLAYTLGGRILAQPRRVVVVASSNGPRGYFVSGQSAPTSMILLRYPDPGTATQVASRAAPASKTAAGPVEVELV